MEMGGCPIEGEGGTDVYSSLWSPACASSTGPANVVCRWCTGVGCHLPGGGLLHHRKQIEFVRLTRRERGVGEAEIRAGSSDAVGRCWGAWWRGRRGRRGQRPCGFWETLWIAVAARARKKELEPEGERGQVDGGGGCRGCGRGTRMLSSKQKDGANQSVLPFLFRVGGKW